MNTPHWRPVFVGIGSNLDAPEQQVNQAIIALAELPGTMLVSQSRLYRSSPMGPVDQPDFINAVVAVLTQALPRVFFEQMQAIERKQGRKREGERWGPRTIDLDLLAYSGLIIDEEGLTVPHPGIAERNFVLLPWQEIAPNFVVPGLRDVAAMASTISTTEPRVECIN